MRYLAFSLILIFLLSLAHLDQVSAQLSTLHVVVKDASGKPREGAQVTITNGTYTSPSRTNGSGVASFVNISPGTYNVSLAFEGFLIAQKDVKIPDETQVDLVALLSSLRVKASDLSGRALAQKEVVLSNMNLKLNRSLVTNSEGEVEFGDVPHSSVAGVGEYSVKVFIQGIAVANETLSVPAEPFSLRGQVASGNITVLDIAGNPASDLAVNIESESGKASQLGTTSQGWVLLGDLPASTLPGIGRYVIKVLDFKTGIVVEVVNSTRTILSDFNVTLTASIAKLVVKVVDDEGNPLPATSILISHGKSANFSSLNTGNDGTVSLEKAPLSNIVGDYNMVFYRGRAEVGRADASFLVNEQTVTFTVKRQNVRLIVQDNDEAPILNAKLTILDVATGKSFSAVSNELGVAEFKVFHGSYRIDVNIENKEVGSQRIEISAPEAKLHLQSVNFPVRLSFRDVLGLPIENARVSATFDGAAILSGETVSEGTLSVKLPSPGILKVEFRIGDELVYAENLRVGGPFSNIVYLSGFVVVFGAPLRVGILLDLVATLVLSVIVVLNAYLLIVRRWGKIKRKV